MDHNYNQHKNGLINNLPDDCLRKIFSYLGIPDKLNVEKVCKRWLLVSKLGWPEIGRINHNIFYLGFSMRQLEVILCRCGRFLEHADIQVYPEDLRLLKLMKKHCYNLQSIKIELDPEASEVYPPIFVNTLSILFDRLLELKKLEMTYVDSGRMGNEFFEYINNESLQHLHIEGLKRNTGHLRINLSEFSNLGRLVLRNVTIDQESLPGFGNMSNLIDLVLEVPDMPLRYIGEITNFKELRMLQIFSDDEESQISDDHLSAIAKNCVHLETLVLDNLEKLSDLCFHDIAQLKNLRELYIIGLPRITNCSIEKMLQLETLACNKCLSTTSAGFIKLIKESRHLKRLAVAGIVHLTFPCPTFLHAINEAMPHRRINTELKLSTCVCSMPENLSPLLILDSWE